MYQYVLLGSVDHILLPLDDDDGIVEYMQVESKDEPAEDLEEEPEYHHEDIEEEFEQDP